MEGNDETVEQMRQIFDGFQVTSEQGLIRPELVKLCQSLVTLFNKTCLLIYNLVLVIKNYLNLSTNSYCSKI